MWNFIKDSLGFINTYFKSIILLLILFFIFIPSDDVQENRKPNLAKLYLNFPIYESETFAQQIESIKKNKNIKGVLLIINSPGGGVGASIEIADMIQKLSQEMPVIAYVQSLMASGSYYAGMYANKIYANRGALIGSIGVIFSGLNLEEVMQKIGVKTQGATAGEYKEVGTMMRTWSMKEREFIENLTNEQYIMFYTDVIKARAKQLKTKNPKDFAEGKVFSAKQALELGLIDEVGTMDNAINALVTMSGVSEIVWLKKSKIDTYMDKVMNGAFNKIIMSSMPNMYAILR
ncbi:signal peptide peptidase SppA [Helicobacter didelphidarum]|uniref:signal peptide peptidase SppA n=1 Tax=Helicobacter didelphidarum TaxID=2040648 RepID=UPI0038B38991